MEIKSVNCTYVQIFCVVTDENNNSLKTLNKGTY